MTHNDAPQSVGLLRTSDQLVAETPTWQHTTLTTDIYSCPRRNSNPQSQQASGRRPTPLASYTLSVKLSDFTVWRHTWRKNWVNCAVLTGNNAGLRTVLSSRLSHTELRSSFTESHSFLSLPANTTMASSQGTSVSSNSFSRWASHDIFLFKYHFLPHILRFLFFFSDNIMADVASKQ